MIFKATEKGQALILIALAAIGLFAFAALAIDGSRVYSDKRHAQNAADSAALAGALVYARGGTGAADDDIRDKVRERAESNGYDFTDPSNSVTVTFAPYADCPSGVPGREITIKIVSHLDMTLARVIGRNQFTNETTATTHACQADDGMLFNGDAIVGLKPNDGGNCAIDTGSSNAKTWKTSGGGVFSNGCLVHNKGELTIPADKCVRSIGNADTGSDTDLNGDHVQDCVQENLGASRAYAYPADIAAMMPTNPCTGPIAAGQYAGGGKVPTAGQTTFNNGVFCISDFDTLDAHIELDNATLYVIDESFSSRFNGGGNTGFFGSATGIEPDDVAYSGSEIYKGYYMIIKLLSKAQADDCDQYFDFRGNGNLKMVGTLFAPSTCLDYRGNSTGWSTHSQMIFYRFTSNGNAHIDVTYQANENSYTPVDGNLTLWK